MLWAGSVGLTRKLGADIFLENALLVEQRQMITGVCGAIRISNIIIRGYIRPCA